MHSLQLAADRTGRNLQPAGLLAVDSQNQMQVVAGYSHQQREQPHMKDMPAGSVHMDMAVEVAHSDHMIGLELQLDKAHHQAD